MRAPWPLLLHPSCAGDGGGLAEAMAEWPEDVGAYALRLLGG